MTGQSWTEQFAMLDKVIQQRNIRNAVEMFKLTRYFSSITNIDKLLHNRSVKSVAIDLILCALPYGWYRAFDKLGRVYYFDLYNNTSWTHPGQEELLNTYLSSQGLSNSHNMASQMLNNEDNDDYNNNKQNLASEFEAISPINKRISRSNSHSSHSSSSSSNTSYTNNNKKKGPLDQISANEIYNQLHEIEREKELRELNQHMKLQMVKQEIQLMYGLI